MKKSLKSTKEKGLWKQKIQRALANDVLFYLLVGGGVLIAMSISPALLAPALLFRGIKEKEISKQKAQNTIYYLKRKGLVKVERNNEGSVSVRLTKTGKQKVIKDNPCYTLFIKRYKKWNGVWFIVIFDIRKEHNVKRDALRRLLKRLGFYQLQKSVWLFPFDCREEIQHVKTFFDLNDDEVRLIISKDIGDDRKIKKIFEL